MFRPISLAVWNRSRPPIQNDRRAVRPGRRGAVVERGSTNCIDSLRVSAPLQQLPEEAYPARPTADMRWRLFVVVCLHGVRPRLQQQQRVLVRRGCVARVQQ